MAKKKNDPSQKWYYDACALENEMILKEIMKMNRKYPRLHIISHLSLGEAYGSCCNKGKEAASSFLDLMEKLLDRYFENIKIVGNDCPKKIIDYIRKNFVLSITDALHLATAVKNKCCILRTTDYHLYNLSKQKIRGLKEKFNLSQFAITEMKRK